LPHPGPPAARGHLRLAGPPAARRRLRESRIALVARAVVAGIVLTALTVLGWLLAALALLPLAWRRAPVGVRLHPLHPRQAQVIPFERLRSREALTR
jgi:hypothetical protein